MSKLTKYYLFSPLIVAVASTLMGILVGYIIYSAEMSSSTGGSVGGPGSGIALAIFYSIACINLFCGVGSYTILFNRYKSVSSNFVYSLATFFWPAGLCFFISLFMNELAPLVIFLIVIPFSLIQFFNYIYFAQKVLPSHENN